MLYAARTLYADRRHDAARLLDAAAADRGGQAAGVLAQVHHGSRAAV